MMITMMVQKLSVIAAQNKWHNIYMSTGKVS